MPLAIDPNETFDVVLKNDAEKGTPVSFRFRYMTAREFLRTAKIGDMPAEEREALGTEAVVKQLFGVIRSNLIQFAGPGLEIDAEIEDVITITEAWELYWSSRRQSRLSVTEKNDSGSPSPSSGDDSAKDAPAGTSASIPLTSGSPPSSNAPAAEAPAATSATPETSG